MNPMKDTQLRNGNSTRKSQSSRFISNLVLIVPLQTV